MSFAHPLALWLALPVFAACALAVGMEARRSSLRFPAHAFFAARGESLRAVMSRWAPVCLTGVALLLIVFALARPQKVTRERGSLGQGIDIMLAIDTSLSMSAIDFTPNRLAAAVDTAKRFVQGRAQDRIGIVVFGGAPILACPLTVDYDAVASQLDTLTPGMTRTDGTAIGDGIVSALNHLKDGSAQNRVIILLTDGRSNTGIVDPLTAAQTAASQGVKIYTIGTAKKGASLMPYDDPVAGRVMVRIDDDLDDELLDRIAAATGGRSFRATNLVELTEIYKTIDSLEKSKVELPPVVARRDFYRNPTLAAAGLLLLDVALTNSWLLRWP